MTLQERKNLNQTICRLAFGRQLRLSKETLATIINAVDDSAEGHLSRLTDDYAMLVHKHLCNIADGKTAAPKRGNERQNNFVPRLMEYLKWNWTDTKTFVKHVTGKNDTRNCNPAELSKVIRGMIAMIDKDIVAGKITLTREQKMKYNYYAKHHREPSPQPSPLQEEGVKERSNTCIL